ncbi:MAG: hypothetical protein LBL57_04760 [Tannerella sp.]|jgi:hypothetical protein|nr:hypothetical protein [Tannerella sp.]
MIISKSNICWGRCITVPVRQAHELALPVLTVLTVMRQRYPYPGRVRDIARRAFISYLFILYGE